MREEVTFNGKILIDKILQFNKLVFKFSQSFGKYISNNDIDSSFKY